MNWDSEKKFCARRTNELEGSAEGLWGYLGYEPTNALEDIRTNELGFRKNFVEDIRINWRVQLRGCGGISGIRP